MKRDLGFKGLGTRLELTLSRYLLKQTSKILGLILFGLIPRSACFAAGGTCPSNTPVTGNNCYFIAANGSDSNNGTSESTPWAHLPGMRSCVGNCASHGPAPAEGFVLRGCDTWGNSDLPVLWNWSGGSGNPITITVDKTWYNATKCPSGWNRPVFDSGKNILPTINYYWVSAWNGDTSWGVLDNIEMKNLTGSSSPAYVSCFNSCHNWVFSNLYLHAWNVQTDGSCSLVTGIGANESNNLFTSSVIDGTDRTGESPAGGTCYAIFPDSLNVTNNVIHDGLANGMVSHGTGTSQSFVISGNLIYNIIESNAASHPNCLETVGGGDTYYIHDNVFHDCAGETLMFGNTGEVDYIWNNVFYNIPGDPVIAPQGPGMTGMSFAMWNNTIQNQTSDGGCIVYNAGDGGSFTSAKIQNIHCVNASGSGIDTSWPGTTAIVSGNVQQTVSQANGQGYTGSQTYVYSPTAGSPRATIGAGTNLTSSCAGSNVGLCSDTAYACTQQTINGVVQAVCPARVSNKRFSSGAWDVGAYQFSSSQSQPPQSPTNLTTTAY